MPKLSSASRMPKSCSRWSRAIFCSVSFNNRLSVISSSRCRAGRPVVSSVCCTRFARSGCCSCRAERVTATVKSLHPASSHALVNSIRYRYVSKPWIDHELTLLVQEALEFKQLKDEKKRLEALSIRQNGELTELNATLEQKVAARTEELRQAMPAGWRSRHASWASPWDCRRIRCKICSSPPCCTTSAKSPCRTSC